MTAHEISCDVPCGDRHARVVALSDGRRLGYAEWGAPNGWPLLFFHGTPSSRLGLEWVETLAADAGARVLSLDRPGLGLSDPAPNRTLLGWSRDVAAFADALSLERFAVAGWSGGGPYVLACAAMIPDRLTHAAVLSGCGPLETRAQQRASSDFDRTMLRLSRRTPLAARAVMRPVVAGARRAPALAVKSIERDLSTRDLETFRRLNPDPRLAIESFLEAFRSGSGGVIDDYRVLASPWGFAPEEITMPVHFWHGDADRIVGLADTQTLAGRMPNAIFDVVPGEGHLLLMNRAADVLAALAP